jgi:uncharacterized protein (TIGR02231 family)
MRAALAAAAFILLTGVAEAEDVTVPSRVDAVTVFLSGAEVTRIATVKLDKGDHTIIVSDLPAQARPGSIRVEGKVTGKLEIGSVDTRRLVVPRAAEAGEERRKLEDEIERLRDSRALVEGQQQAAETQKTLITNLAQLPTRPAPQGAVPSGQGEDWSRILALIGAGLADVNRSALEAEVKLRELDRQINDLEGKLRALSPAKSEQTEVKIYARAAAPLDGDIIVHYQVPNASWKPLYDARLATGGKASAPKLELTRRAAISQRTGEAWTDVTLSLSTTHPQSAASAPVLSPLTVDYEPERKEIRPMAAPAPAPVARDTAEADGRAAGARGEARFRAAAPPPPRIEAEQAAASVSVAPFEAVFGVPGRVTVEATGEAKRVQLLSDTVEPVLAARTVPKIDTKAYLYAKLTLPKGTPLLPGPVSLFRDGTFVGTGQLPLLSPGEEHDLGFGADDQVRVRYAIADEKRGETGLISSSHTDQRNYRITVRNMHERAIELCVLDQIPVSQNQEIKVDLVGPTAPTRQNVDDKRGLIAFDGKLEPDQERVIEFGYRVVWPAAKSIVYNR